MKNKIFISLSISLFVFFSFLFTRVNYQEIFLQANELYKNSEFEKAYELYKKIEVISPQVNYNLGNCAYQLGDHGYAMLYWRRAEKDWSLFDRGELLDNIRLLKNKVFYKTDYKSTLKFRSTNKNKLFISIRNFKDYVVSIFRSVSLFTLQILFLILWFFLFLYLRYLYKRKRKILIVILFFLIALAGSLLILRYSLLSRKCGVIIRKNVTLLSGPGEKFQKLGVLPQAGEVFIYKSSDDFYKIKFYKQVGWVKIKDVEKI
ncbi:hypothetical protein KAT08_00210 [Candidatus Babeliales bacterium]|nr:hypothetical protein [Candidatus Babeliales bacterium]